MNKESLPEPQEYRSITDWLASQDERYFASLESETEAEPQEGEDS